MGNIKWSMDADTDRVMRGFQKIIEKERELASGLKDMGRSGRKSGEGLAAGLLKATVVISAAKKGVDLFTESLRFANEEAKRGAEFIGKLEEGQRRLIQVARTRAEFEALKGMSQSLMRAGIEDKTAQQMVFEAKSQGIVGSLPFFARASQFMDPVIGIKSAGKFRGAFKEEAGTPRQITNKNVIAAFNADVTVDAMASSAVSAAQGVARLGGSDEELLGLMSVLSKAFKSPETAAFRIARFAAVAETASGRTFERVTPEAQAARDRLGEIGTGQSGIDSQLLGIRRDREEARIGAQSPMAKKLLAVRELAWRKEVLSLERRSDAFDAEASRLKPISLAEKYSIDLRGKGVMNAYDIISSLPADVRTKMLGESIQAKAAYTAIGIGSAGIRAAITSVNRGNIVGPDDASGVRFGIAEGDVNLPWLRQRDANLNKYNLGLGGEGGLNQLKRDTFRAQMMSVSKDIDESAPKRWLRGAVWDVVDFFGGDPDTMRKALTVEGDKFAKSIEADDVKQKKIIEDLGAAAQKLAEAADKINQATTPTPTPNGGDLD